MRLEGCSNKVMISAQMKHGQDCASYLSEDKFALLMLMRIYKLFEDELIIYRSPTQRTSLCRSHKSGLFRIKLSALNKGRRGLLCSRVCMVVDLRQLGRGQLSVALRR
jgi:hypothetical protein